MSRTDNVKNNLVFNMIKYVTQLVLQFVLRTVLIYYMGAEYLGLNGLFTNIFNFLNLAELGIGSAIVFSMYKPIAEGDTEKVKALQALYKKYYSIIAIIVFALGIIIMPFIKYFINGEVKVDINIYLLFLLYLINTLGTYLSAHKRSLLFAYQRNDIENKVKTLSLIGMTLLQILVLILFKNYYIYFTVNIIFTILEAILVRAWANKLYPEINGKAETIDKDTKKEITKNVVALSMHKVGTVIVFSTDNILISAMFGLVLLGAYSNYYLVITSIMAIYSLLSNALSGSVGNLIATRDKEYVYKKYSQINTLFSLFTSFTTICMICLFQPFIKLWTGGGEYLLSLPTVMLICLSYYLTKMRAATNIFKDSAGLFWENRIMPVAEAIVNLVASIVLGLFMGINGVVLGTIISTIVAPLWVEPKTLYKHYFNKNVWQYFYTYIRDVVIMVLVGFVCYFICSFIPDGTLLFLILKFAICGLLTGGLLVIAYLPTKSFRESLMMLKDVAKNTFKKK